MPTQCHPPSPAVPPTNDDDITYDPKTGSYVVDVTLDERDVVPDAVVTAIATVRDADVTELPPLANVVDTDALGGVFRGHDGATTDIQVSFDYAGFRVTVSGVGEVRLVEA